TGVIAINGVGGSIVIAGQLDASGTAPGSAGGKIQLLATDAVTVKSGATINASGAAGGGLVAVGTTLKRAADASVTSARTARKVVIESGATIAADATVKGHGGRVTVLSNKSTRMAGTITAKGGKQGGDGGFVEVSGEEGFSLTGRIDVTAPMGNLGTILLDPTNLDIIGDGTGSLDGTLDGANKIAYGDGGTNETVSNTEIDSLSGKIILQATKHLTVDANAPITLKNNASLTLETKTGDITVDAGSPITAKGTGTRTFLAGQTSGSGGKIVLNDNLATGSSGSITLQADGGINFNAVSVNTGVLDVSNITSGGVSQTTGGTITATTLQSTKSIAGGLTLTSVNNAIGTLGAVTASSGDIAVVSNPGTGLKIANTVSATSGNLYVANSDTAGIVFTASGAASASGIVGLQADKLTLPAGATISAATAEIAPSTSGKTVTLGATGGLSLANVTGITANTLRVGAITLPGSATPTIEAGSIAVAGAFDTKTISTLDLQATGAVTQTAALTTGTLLATAGTIALTNTANSIGAFGSLTATSGNIA